MSRRTDIAQREERDEESGSASGSSEHEERDDRAHYENEGSTEVSFGDRLLTKYMLSSCSSVNTTLQVAIVKNTLAEETESNEVEAVEGALEVAFLVDLEADLLVVVRDGAHI